MVKQETEDSLAALSAWLDSAAYDAAAGRISPDPPAAAPGGGPGPAAAIDAVATAAAEAGMAAAWARRGAAGAGRLGGCWRRVFVGTEGGVLRTLPGGPALLAGVGWGDRFGLFWPVLAVLACFGRCDRFGPVSTVWPVLAVAAPWRGRAARADG